MFRNEALVARIRFFALKPESYPAKAAICSANIHLVAVNTDNRWMKAVHYRPISLTNLRSDHGSIPV
jgi:hypothetical protein